MKSVLQVLGSIALLAFCWLAGEAAWTIHQLRPHLEVTLENVDRTVIIAGAAATHLEKASGTWEKSSQEQSSNISAAMSNVNAAAKQLTIFISSTGKSVNSTLVPSLDLMVRQQNAALLTSQEGLQANLRETLEVTQQFHKVLLDADTQINSPDVKIALDNVAASSQNLATATNEGAGMLKDAHQVEDYEIKQIEAPVTKVKVVWHVILDVIRHLYF